MGAYFATALKHGCLDKLRSWICVRNQKSVMLLVYE